MDPSEVEDNAPNSVLGEADGVDQEAEPPENPEEERRKAFETRVQAILEKLKNLKSTAKELKPAPISLDVEKVYAKLCKTLNVPTNCTLLFNHEGETMNFAYQGIGEAGVIPLAKVLSLCKSVRVLDLSYNKLGPKSLIAVANLLDQNESIASLNLSGNAIGKDSGKFLNKLVSHCYSVEFLDLSDNNLGDDELPEIGQAAAKVDSIKELVLSMNDFGGARAPQFGAYLARCGALLKLDLSGCRLEEGAGGVFAALRTSNLTELNLSGNAIPNEATAALAAGLKSSKALRILDVSRNAISNQGAVTLAPGLKGASALEVFNVAHNPIQGSGAFALLNSVGGSLKVLDLTGIKVNLAFLKMHGGMVKSGKGVKVLFGAIARFDCGARPVAGPPEDDADASNVLPLLERLAQDKGLGLRSVLKNLHASFISEQHAALAEEAEAKDKEERPGMTVDELTRALATSPLAVPKSLAQKISELLADENGFVDVWGVIARVRWKPDDLFVNVKAAPRPPPPAKKDKKK